MHVIKTLTCGLIVLVLTACAWGDINRPHVTLDWTTGTEVDTAGFNLYRSDSENGAYVKINATLIPASNDPVIGGKYRYDDFGVKPGQTYFYQLEDVELTGKATRHTPIRIAVAGNGEGIILPIAVILFALILVGAWFKRKRR